MIPVEALKLALLKEVASIKFYDGLYQRHTQLKDILLFLITEEQKHRELIEKKIRELAGA